MKVQILTALTFLTFSLTLSAQEKNCTKSFTKCNAICKVKCGPDGTKTGEAKIITALREKVQQLKLKLTEEKIDGLVLDLFTEAIPQGEDDDTIISILRNELIFIEKSILSADLQYTNQISLDSGESKAQQVASLHKHADLLMEQIEKL